MSYFFECEIEKSIKETLQNFFIILPSSKYSKNSQYAVLPNLLKIHCKQE